MPILQHPVRPAPRGAGRFRHPSEAPRWHLLGLQGRSRDDILDLLDAADACRVRLRAGGTPFDDLRGVTVVLAFFEDSTRTRVSFELAARHLGATVATLTAAGSSVSKGESLFDTMQNILAMGTDVVVVRHPSSGAPAFLASQLDVSVVNAGDGRHEHPTQGLLDLMTLRDVWNGRFEGRRLALVGDIAHSRGLVALGASVVVAGPNTLLPAEVERLGCTVAPTVDQAMDGADAVMALRLQRERMDSGLLPSTGEFSKVWGITPERVRLMNRDAKVLHPGPMNRGVEVATEVADGERSVILDQVENGVALRCAVLARCVEADVAMRRAQSGDHAGRPGADVAARRLG